MASKQPKRTHDHYTRFDLDRSTPSLWRVTFDNPPIDLIDAVMMKELLNLLTEIERDKRVGVVLFDSADPDFFLAHYDIAGDPAEHGAQERVKHATPWNNRLSALASLGLVVETRQGRLKRYRPLLKGV